MPRPAAQFSPETRQQVATWAAAGVHQVDIAASLAFTAPPCGNITPVIDAAACKARADIALAMYEAATRRRSPSVAAARLYLSGALGRHRG